jgi:single-strand DNA-binding protein
MNKIVIHGHLGRDPELKPYKTSKGEDGKLVSFAVGVSRTSGDETDWFDCTAFGKTAEVIDKFLRKGSEVIIEGAMESRKYEAKDGSKRTAWGIRVERFEFCGKKDNVGKPSPDHDSFQQAEEDIPF